MIKVGGNINNEEADMGKQWKRKTKTPVKWRFLSLCLALALLTALLAGCSASGTGESTAQGTGSETAVELNIVDDNYRNYYEIFVYSFYDSDGDGIGDLNGVTEKLDYIADMGFNGIWLMPIMPSPSYHKYDVTDYYDIDPVYGTIEDFENLVEECHSRGIRLIIDMVINHSSSQHEWFTTACEYLASLGAEEEPDVTVCPYVEYYHFSREQESGVWYEIPGATAGAEWYYEGEFSSEMPDLNLECEALKEELENIADFWLELGVDGFRMDAAMHFDETDGELNRSILNWLYTYCCETNPDFYMVSEVWAGSSTIESYYASETPSFFNFPNSSVDGVIEKTAMGTATAEKFVNTMLTDQQTYSAVYADYIDAPFLTNHDQVRVANNLQNNESNMKMACGLLMTMNGSPFVYYGEEIGMKSKGQSDENKRIPMYWSDTDTTGMTVGPENMEQGITSSFAAVDEQLADETSILSYYKEALLMRNQNPEIARGEITIVEELTSEDTAVILKTWEESTIAILYNTDTEAVTIDLTGTALEGMELQNCLTVGEEEITLADGVAAMPGQSICVLR
ncbi:MAG: alpha amylase [Lachnospiraceae bacterium]|nr:alpha amylase [Lachnospiraceae bacterium]